jgi:hypothetical protein
LEAEGMSSILIIPNSSHSSMVERKSHKLCAIGSIPIGRSFRL